MKKRFVAALMVALGATGLHSYANQASRRAVRWTPVEISTALYESSAVFAPRNQEVYFMRADRKFDGYRILQSRCTSDGWSDPVEVAFSAEPGAQDADPFVTRDGSGLFFISTRHRFSKTENDDFDIFFVERTPDGGWGVPERLPEPVNSTGSELLPRLDSNGTLYFGSDRPGGLGGTDIYSATRAASGEWTVVNVESLNTASNEYEADVSTNGKEIAVISDREGKSRVHLFRRDQGEWRHQGRIRAREAVFQVGPLWSPDGRRLMFSQDAGKDSGEIFVIDIHENPDPSWPPTCSAK